MVQYRASSSVAMPMAVNCVPTCMGGTQWTCDASGNAVDSGKECVAPSPEMVIGAVALVGVVGIALLATTGKKRKG